MLFRSRELRELEKGIRETGRGDLVNKKNIVRKETDKQIIELHESIRKLEEHEAFLKNQNTLREFRPHAQGLARLAQNIAGLGVLSLGYNPIMALKSAALASAFAPNLQASGYKAVGPRLSSFAKKAGSALESSSYKQMSRFAAAKISREKIRNKE